MKTLKHTPLLLLVILCPVLLLLTACTEPKADVSNPQSFSKEGIHFEYPGNWEITEDTVEHDVRYIIAETPGDAILILQAFPKSLDMQLYTFGKRFSKAMGEELPIGKLVDVNFASIVELPDCQQLKETFAIELLTEHVKHQREYRKYSTENTSIFLIAQVQVDDYKRVEPGFELIFKSLNVDN